MEIGENLKKVGIKFISSIDIDDANSKEIIMHKDGNFEISTLDSERGLGEATEETQKKLEDLIIYDTNNKEANK